MAPPQEHVLKSKGENYLNHLSFITDLKPQ